MDKDAGYRPSQMDGFTFRFYFIRIWIMAGALW